MNHPTREELTLHLLGEAPVEGRQRVTEHLRSCPACAGEVKAWRGSLRRLNRWRLRPPTAGFMGWWTAPAWRWAAATIALLALGFVLGRWPAPTGVDTREQRAAREASLRASIQQEFDAKLEAMFLDLRAEVAAVTGSPADLETIAAATALASQAQVRDLWREFLDGYSYTRAEDRREILALRRDLETLAVLADTRLDVTQQQLGRLAVFVQPAVFNPDSPTNP